MDQLSGTRYRVTDNVLPTPSFSYYIFNHFKTQKIQQYFNSCLVFLIFIFISLAAKAQAPVITARFSNPAYNFTTQTYKVDVEFQSNTSNIQIDVINVRFWYDDSVLEFISFTDLVTGYFLTSPNPPQISTKASYGPYFGFCGAAEWVNGAIDWNNYTVLYVSTTGWTKLFSVNFHVDNPVAQNISFFWPSIVWDLEENPTQGGYNLNSEGFVITIGTSPYQTIENVDQFNWQYDGIPGTPWGYPVQESWVSTRVAPKVIIDSVLAVAGDFVTFPVSVTDFFTIGSFNLTLDYNPSVLDYCCVTPHPAVSANFGATVNEGTGEVALSSNGLNATIPDSSELVNITFKYLGGSSALLWLDDGPSCQFVDALNGLVVHDSPSSNYYINGNITSGQYVWTGNTSSNWDTPTNWQSNLVPTQFTNLVISSDPPPLNYPVYNGTFTLGEDCNNFTLTGNAELTVIGDLIVSPGHTLTNSSNGTIVVTGNWINSGEYVPGTGVVEFNGSSNSLISEGTSPVTFVSAFELSPFAAGMIPLSGGSSGPIGDNAHSDVAIGFDFSYLGVTYSQARINTNGWVSLNLTGTDPLSMANENLFTPTEPGTALAPWWDDLLADGSTTISYLTSGTAPNRMFTAEWKNILAYNTGSNARLNFQVKLYETTNVIEFCYGSSAGTTHNSAESASIGIKDAVGGTDHYLEPIYGTSNMVISCLVSNTNWPSENYRFTPPVLNTQEVFHRIDVNKTDGGKLIINKDVKVTGL